LWHPYPIARFLSNQRVAETTDEKDKSLASEADIRILKNLSKHLWPSMSLEDKDKEKNIKVRVISSLFLLTSAKLVNIQVPFLFKHIIDEYNLMDSTALTTADPLVAAPVMLVIGYGIARSTASFAHEARTAVFSTVAQDVIRRVARDVFRHLHSLDMQFHINKSTGVVSRIIDRGSRSINFALSAMLFNVAPTILEVGLVSGLLAWNLGPQYALVACGTVGAYVIFTINISSWRIKIRQAMNRNENEASGNLISYRFHYSLFYLEYS
jgi:ATP-binding cassette, subfamily B (MDR/TAP), member 7